ncbi:4041_t:CDS:2 [Racocetra fulgida]|uniref:4041_t:CDS:1 n=1 Tax=Racocetra fulgida TaxID=60492 RepID=A0A9N8WGG8_9GLOM|nr:4041_t:CDS:2 [Racocetra fulgida]
MTIVNFVTNKISKNSKLKSFIDLGDIIEPNQELQEAIEFIEQL